MYKCNDCGSFVEKLESKFYTDSETNYEGIKYVCPFCGGDDIEDAAECKGCGEPHGESDLTEGLCPKCEKDIQDKVNEFFKQFSEAEIDYIFESGILDEV